MGTPFLHDANCHWRYLVVLPTLRFTRLKKKIVSGEAARAGRAGTTPLISKEGRRSFFFCGSCLSGTSSIAPSQPRSWPIPQFVSAAPLKFFFLSHGTPLQISGVAVEGCK